MEAIIPDHIKRYLWDVPQETISPISHSKFIIERVLEYGDFDSINWIKNQYPRENIIEILKTSNKLSQKTGNLYSLYFDIPKEDLLCIQKPYTQKQNRF